MTQSDSNNPQSREEVTIDSESPSAPGTERDPTLSDRVSMDDEGAEFEPTRLNLRAETIVL